MPILRIRSRAVSLLTTLMLSAFLPQLVLPGLALSAEFRFSPKPNNAHLITWRTWTAALFEEARRLKRPILLSLSAVWCHWCHVMDETTYSDSAIISQINGQFIPVRVDADMRPDIDSLYNQGGWPSTVILAADGTIIRGGTYIPAGRMAEWLEQAVADHKHQSHKSRGQAEETKTGAPSAAGPSPVEDRVLTLLLSSFDRTYGGFGIGQKFPNPETIDFLIGEYVRTGRQDIAFVILTTLDAMARGEIHDTVNGGFFRYATQRDWSEPHFEKMLALNAGLARNYAFASVVFGSRSYEGVMTKTLDYLLGPLRDRRSGMFFGSQDADEGYYRTGNRSPGKAPQIDRTFYAGPNSVMITALIAAHGATGSAKFLQQAREAAGFMLKELYDPGAGVFRYARNGKKHLPGLLSDNVLFGRALLDLQNATGDTRYLDAARAIGRIVTERFYDAEQRWFRTSLDTTLVAPPSSGMMMPYASALVNFQTLLFLMRLHHHTGDESMRRIAAEAYSALSADCIRFEPAAANCGAAVSWMVRHPIEIVMVTRDRPQRFLDEVNRMYLPQKVVRSLSIMKNRREITERGYPLEEALYLCTGRRCLAAVTDPRDVQEGIRKIMALADKGQSVPERRTSDSGMQRNDAAEEPRPAP